eukprot:CAMPEP_0194313946 /NCGR_PEP_ID=MMETSP0171-20130528/10775_1 /TAXON_ID=218684 /ORGANISM="Corethron pennatum, Strain L29A3" /LENGTH=455 /DNA_ID=CAMNT_0039069123 /DNA_START=1 /DNA_END=1368 /DNA_ORIENTATION=+
MGLHRFITVFLSSLLVRLIFFFGTSALQPINILEERRFKWNIVSRCATGGKGDDPDATAPTRRDALAVAATVLLSHTAPASAASIPDEQTYIQRFPTLFDPIIGRSRRRTIRTPLGSGVWALEQSLALGPLETPLRCVVVRLRDGSLWVHAPLAPTEEFFAMVEACGDREGRVTHVVVPSYALEHKVFAGDALQRWPKAQLWTSPGQFSFPIRRVSDKTVWGRNVDGVLGTSDRDSTSNQPPWTDEIQYETLAAGTFNIGGVPTTFYETAFFHVPSRSLIVTDAVCRIPVDPPPLNDVDRLLLVSKRSTADPAPLDTQEARTIGWEKTALLVSYFFPEHEEIDPTAPLGTVTWTPGWHDNFKSLSNRLLVPPVVRTLLYANDPGEVQNWVDRVSKRWDFVRIIPAHYEAPITAGPDDLRLAFRFLEDETMDAFPKKDLERGLKPIADLVLRKPRI